MATRSTGREMDNEPQGQAGKRVVDSFSFTSIIISATPSPRHGSRGYVRIQATLANKIKLQQMKEQTN